MEKIFLDLKKLLINAVDTFSLWVKENNTLLFRIRNRRNRPFKYVKVIIDYDEGGVRLFRII